MSCINNSVEQINYYIDENKTIVGTCVMSTDITNNNIEIELYLSDLAKDKENELFYTIKINPFEWTGDIDYEITNIIDEANKYGVESEYKEYEFELMIFLQGLHETIY